VKTAAALVAAIVLGSPAWAQDQRRARPVRSEVRVIIEESPDGDYDHDYYEQLAPVEFRGGTPGLASSVWYRTVCRPQEEDRAPIYLPLRPPPPTTLPLTVSAAASVPRFRVTATPQQILTITGNPRVDPGTTTTTTTPTPGPSTKPALFGGAEEGSETSTDAPLLFGPDFDFIVASDVTAWSALRWLPEGTSLHLYARALFGSVEMFDTPTSLQLYGVGPRLTVPLAKAGSLELGLTVSAGPAFLHSALGDAVGFDGGIGVRLEHFFTPTVSFVAAVEAKLYFSDNVTSFGPVVNLGFNLAW
jgi:hypothetical protein